MFAKLSAAEYCGLRHSLMGRPCQDRAGGCAGENFGCAVLCDGAGSRPQSERAAQQLVDWLPGWLEPRFEALWADHDPAPKILHAARAALEPLGLPPEDCWCTLLFFAQRPDGRWLCGHIGDGYIFRVEQGKSRVLSGPENGRFANETYFVTGPLAEQHLRVQKGAFHRSGAVLLASDGSGAGLYDLADRRPAPAVATLARWLEKHPSEQVTPALARALRENLSTRSEDDLSLALLWTSPAPLWRSLWGGR